MLHLATIANRRRHSVGYALLSILGAKIQTLEKNLKMRHFKGGKVD